MKGLRTSKKDLGTHSFYAKKRMVVSVPLDSWVPSNLQMPSWATLLLHFTNALGGKFPH